MELWKNVDGYPGYQVSSMGRVRSCRDYHGKLRPHDYHMLKPRVNSNGYEIVVLYDAQHKPWQASVHRLVAMYFLPIDDLSLVVDHLDGDKQNNAATNLEWVTSRENSHRAYRAGLYENSYAITRRPVVFTDLRNGEETYFTSIHDAARKTGYSTSAISKAANVILERLGVYSVEFAGREDRLLYGRYN